MALGVCSLLSLARGAKAEEEGEEQEGLTTLKERLDSTRPRKQGVVQAKRFEKAQRLELFPHVYANVLNNSYAHRFLVLSGVGASYHFKESFFGELVLDYFPHFDSVVPGFSGLKPLTWSLARMKNPDDLLVPDIPKERLALGVSVGVSPIYGKINLVSSYVQNFDISFMAGAGVLLLDKDTYRVQEVPDSYDVTLGAPEARQSKPFVSPNLGMSLRFFMTRSLTLRADARAWGYFESVIDMEEPLGDGQYATRTVFRNSFVLTAGVSGFIPGR